MQLDAARELKHEALALRPGTPAATTFATGAPVPARGLVGIAPSAHGYRLAVRLTAPDDAGRSWAQALAERSRGEVDVRVVGPIRPLPAPARSSPADLQRRVRPLHRGLSVGHAATSAGTLGAFVTRGPAGAAPLLLSNSHVLALSGRAAAGDPVYQPGPSDGGGPADRVGALLGAVPLSATAANVVDAALATLDPGVAVDPAAGDGPLAGVWRGSPEALLAQGVQKIGRTTGVTYGRVTAFEVDAVPVAYDGGVLTFDDQVEIEGDAGPFSAAGDSGSVICSVVDRLAVGLLFAGSSTGGAGGSGLTYANPLAAVLQLLGVSLVPG